MTPTDRQLEVLSTVVAVGVKGAAHHLRISTRTVKAHIAAARARAGCDSTLQLVAWCDDHIPKWRERRGRWETVAAWVASPRPSGRPRKG